ncbi:fumarylacetoacetate hydrolase family protein [Actinocorallia sp. A-T 12471]|uniref:fumarylacetoacetate hydrolase family protein n=1 Tax=Actinocorallia sp. A-T 12471 TaxID=3089813 RepID=UPI0029CEFBAB|nr:fumarylacetoacetate hydrolase family protein [Actinocorallia sp. A-T 12471]MDX6740208.1 fumarylacetoacetate hydrolase family protein [Actinocorallia sp. A-T 12471]
METCASFAGRYALGTFSGADGRRFAGLVAEDRVLDLGRAGIADTTRAVLERWDELSPELGALAAGSGDGWTSLADLRVHAPIEPRQIFQSGANYRTHVIDLMVAHREDGDPRSEEEVRAATGALMDSRAAHGTPYVFVGLPTAITGPYDDVVIPEWCTKPDWELELTAVIGREAHRVSVEDALDHVAAYTIANDITAREVVFRRDMPEIGTDWLQCKNAPTFTPLGPYLVPADAVGDTADLRVTLTVNGTTYQDESTKDMIFDVARLVSHISQSARLLPGDLVLTGSPAGNGLHWGRLLTDGDVMEGSVTGLGTQRNRVVR